MSTIRAKEIVPDSSPLNISGDVTVEGTLSGVYQASSEAEINTHLTTIGANGGTIFLAPGTYAISADISIANNGIKIIGSGRNTLFEWKGKNPVGT